ncbi:NAD(P)-dependent oxidoreductase [Prevotella nigrescens]|uniref:NAD-dependent epimerase/dehydratase family protein n=1 Tax=Prevotella nigrescens TaxID=28133 RepID=UPI001BA4B345|nr:NAD(P)-dependent oxidoreductase [Prevotella nigrescens]QUB49195.1 NAD(P)-dependent oxidoreductase [Prevotella nigrescens]
MKKRILITGASGFIGSFIVAEALRHDMEVWAAIRATSSKKYLQDERIHFIELDFSLEEKLKKQLQSYSFDYVVHAAGATKCRKREDFFRINTQGTQHFVNALLALNMPIERFVFISSLSVYGAIHEQLRYKDIDETDIPRPNTAYGESKLKAEKVLANTVYNGKTLPYVILRPTGVYGPREKDYFLMAKSIKGHIDFSVGFQRQDITFIYVKDLVQAVFLAIDKAKIGRAYFLTDGEVYQSSTFSNLIRAELGNPWWIRIKAPIALLRIVTFFGDILGRITGKLSPLNNDKYQILKQRNWRCNIQPIVKELGYKPEYNLERGVKETMDWYKNNGWL